MNTHKNASMTARGRETMVRLVVDDGQTIAAVARRFKLSAKTVAKWVKRFRENGVKGLQNRSSRPHSSPSQINRATGDAVEKLRRDRYIQTAIAKELEISPASVSRILKQRGISLLSSLEPTEPRPRYERKTPGEIIHIDIKKLSRFNRMGHRVTGDRTDQQRHRKANGPQGSEYVHVAIDDHSRVAFTEIKPTERKEAAVQHLKAAVAYYRSLGVTVTRVMTDNGGCYRSRLWRKTCQDLGIKHLRTKPYTPQTNGKAERFIQTAIREWAYAKAFENSEQRKMELPNWIHRYNWHRPHASLNGMTPISRIGLTGNNLLRCHS